MSYRADKLGGVDTYTHALSLTHTHTQTQATTIPEGQNWPRIKTVGQTQRICRLFLVWTVVLYIFTIKNYYAPTDGIYIVIAIAPTIHSRWDATLQNANILPYFTMFCYNLVPFNPYPPGSLPHEHLVCNKIETAPDVVLCWWIYVILNSLCCKGTQFSYYKQIRQHTLYCMAIVQKYATSDHKQNNDYIEHFITYGV